ncbi:MAG: hypothetical protein WC209_06365 [Ignavibacteriaceae bacterium]|jgi:hypothetical protein
MELAQNKYVTPSLVSTIITGVFTSIHHTYEIGAHAIFLVLLFIVLPSILMRWFVNTGKGIALWIYWLLTAWLVIGLGLIDGFINHAIKPIGFQIQALVALHGGGGATVENAFEGNIIYEVTGLLTFVASMFAGYYGVKLIRSIRNPMIKTGDSN